MKKLLLPIFGVVTILSASCGRMEMKKITMDQVHQVEDSIPKILPGNISMHTLQDDDYSKVVIIIGSPSLFKTDADLQQSEAVRTGMALLRVLGPSNSLSTGRLVFSENDFNDDKVPEGSISVDMKLDSLNKVIFK